MYTLSHSVTVISVLTRKPYLSFASLIRSHADTVTATGGTDDKTSFLECSQKSKFLQTLADRQCSRCDSADTSRNRAHVSLQAFFPHQPRQNQFFFRRSAGAD